MDLIHNSEDLLAEPTHFSSEQSVSADCAFIVRGVTNIKTRSLFMGEIPVGYRLDAVIASKGFATKY